MKITAVSALYFSPTGNTKKVVCHLAGKLAEQLQVEVREIEWTTPQQRKEQLFSENELVVVGSPTYAGKLPNKILPEFQSLLKGTGTKAVAVVTFGNRSFDNSAAELTAVLNDAGFCTVAAGAFVSRHAFSDALATGRPDAEDLKEIEQFAHRIAQKISAPSESLSVTVQGDAQAPYYVPKGVDGQPAKFLKAKPLTHADRCSGCGLCASLCPMASINPEDCTDVPGICIKCQSCVRNCPASAKYFADEAFLLHVQMLEQNFARRAENYTAV